MSRKKHTLKSSEYWIIPEAQLASVTDQGEGFCLCGAKG